ncbi:hypothetical protein [Psychromonas aquimarina]|uniref:hypothetical protein n=1 Tax=Psychromonas aquimarina TaxID=444919 RepID=UPI0003FFD16E|nr:hypothetical protein [Psychromonas aquimarina]
MSQNEIERPEHFVVDMQGMTNETAEVMCGKHKNTNVQTVLAKSVLNAAESLGLPKEVTEEIIGQDFASISRCGIDPKSKAGELSLLLVHCYRSLYSLMDGDVGNMQYFMRTANKGTDSIPNEQIKTAAGLVTFSASLDAMRGNAHELLIDMFEDLELAAVVEESKDQLEIEVDDDDI